MEPCKIENIESTDEILLRSLQKIGTFIFSFEFHMLHYVTIITTHHFPLSLLWQYSLIDYLLQQEGMTSFGVVCTFLFQAQKVT